MIIGPAPGVRLAKLAGRASESDLDQSGRRAPGRRCQCGP